MRTKDVMTRDVVSVMPGHSIRHATQIMLQHDVSGVPVLDGDGVLVGILTEGDLMTRWELGLPGTGQHSENISDTERARRYAQAHAWCVQDVMTSPVVTIGEEDTLATVAAIFLKMKYKRAPVLKDGKIVGIVSRQDLLRAVVEAPSAQSIVGDDRILISVLARLREAGELVGSLPEVSVHRGVIHLSGSAPTQAVRNTIRIIAEGIRGTAGVQDDIVVAPKLQP